MRKSNSKIKLKEETINGHPEPSEKKTYRKKLASSREKEKQEDTKPVVANTGTKPVVANTGTSSSTPTTTTTTTTTTTGSTLSKSDDSLSKFKSLFEDWTNSSKEIDEKFKKDEENKKKLLSDKLPASPVKVKVTKTPKEDSKRVKKETVISIEKEKGTENVEETDKQEKQENRKRKKTITEDDNVGIDPYA